MRGSSLVGRSRRSSGPTLTSGARRRRSVRSLTTCSPVRRCGSLVTDQTSNAVQVWADKWRDVVEQLRRGPAPAEASALLQKARDHVNDAKTLAASGSHGSALAFAEDALVNCADAVLRRDGWRAKGKTGGHQARFAYPGLPEVFSSRPSLLSQIRRLRNTEVYEAAHVVTPQQSADAIAFAEAAIAKVAKVIPVPE